MNIANNLKKIRAEKGYSLEKVARLAYLSLNTIVKIEGENGIENGDKSVILTKTMS